MKVLVTGATGFLGSHIVDQSVQAGDEVTALARPSSDRSYLAGHDIRVVDGDLGDAGSLARACAGVEVVYHSAGRVDERGRRAEFWEPNVEGTRRLLAAARTAGVGRFVFVSSPSVATSYDDGDRFGIDESEPYVAAPKSFYVETKAIAERLVLAADAPDFTTCALRPRMIWGPRSAGWMTAVLVRLKAGRLPDISYGKKVMATITYCDHAAQACLQAARSDRVAGKAYFLGDTEDIDLWEFTRKLAAAFDLAQPKQSIPKPVLDAAVTVFDTLWRIPGVADRWAPPLSSWTTAILTTSSTYDWSAAQRDFGYRPTVPADVGFARYVEWVQSLGGLDALLARY